MNDSYDNDRPYHANRRDDGPANDGYGARNDRNDRGNDRNNDRSGSRNNDRSGSRRGGFGGGQGRRQDVRDEVFSTQVRAGRRRYFFDVRDTQSGDYYLTITEMKRAFEGAPPEKHKIFLYKEDFTKFVQGLQDTIDYVKANLLTPDQLDDLDRGDAQYDEDERYYRDLRAQRAAEDDLNATDRPATGQRNDYPAADDDDAPGGYDPNRRDSY